MNHPKTYTIFYSWQSDNSRSRSFIQSVLNMLRCELEKDGTYQIVIDSDTRGVPGAPNIPATIFKKIENADLFVADMTIINPDEAGRKTPNPNVLLETGYAIHALGWDRIVLLFNEDAGGIDDQLFDLKQHRLTGFSLRKEKKENSQKRLKSNIIANLQMLDSKVKKLEKDDGKLLATIIIHAMAKIWEYYEKTVLPSERLYCEELIAIGENQIALLDKVRESLSELDYMAFYQLLHNLKMAVTGTEDKSGYEYVKQIVEKYMEPLYVEYYDKVHQLPVQMILTEEFVNLFNKIAVKEQCLEYHQERFADGKLVFKAKENSGEVYSIEGTLLYNAEKNERGQITGYASGYEYTGEYVEGRREGKGEEYFRGVDAFSCKGLKGEENCYGTVKCEGIWKDNELVEGTLYGVVLYKEEEQFVYITAYGSDKPWFMDEEVVSYDIMQARKENCKRYYVGNMSIKDGMYDIDTDSICPLCDKIGGVRNLRCWECDE